MYTRRQELWCTEDQMNEKPNVILRDGEVIRVKKNNGTVLEKMGDGKTRIVDLPYLFEADRVEALLSDYIDDVDNLLGGEVADDNGVEILTVYKRSFLDFKSLFDFVYQNATKINKIVIDISKGVFTLPTITINKSGNSICASSNNVVFNDANGIDFSMHSLYFYPDEIMYFDMAKITTVGNQGLEWSKEPRYSITASSFVNIVNSVTVYYANE